MAFRDPIVAGTTLVRDAINSPGFVHGVTGWSINADGTAEFNSILVRSAIIATDFQSSDYSPGVAGFDLNSLTGVIEINNPATIRDITADTIYAAASMTSPGMRMAQDTDVLGQATLSTAFVVCGGIGLTLPYPPSGTMLINISARGIAQVAGQRALLAYRIRDTNAAGTIRHNPSDYEAVEFPDTTASSYGRSTVATGLPTTGTAYIESMARTTNAASAATFTELQFSAVPSL